VEQRGGGELSFTSPGEKVPISAAESHPIVLVVEDDMLIRLNTADMVRDLGFEVIEVVDADQAISILERTQGRRP
jgi:PleD family two-component response regulator